MKGKSVFIRTVTSYYTGRVMRATRSYFVLDQAAWIASTGRFADAMKTGDFSEVEPYPDGWLVRVARGAIVDVTDWPHPLPRTQI